MASIPAKLVAKEVSELIGMGKRPNICKIAPKYGYSLETARTGLVQKTKSYQDTMAVVVYELERERQRAIERLKSTVNKAKYRDLVDGIDKLTKNIQLLNGGKTSNEGLSISWE